MNNRDPFWDNVKLALIVLVVIGHFILPVRSDSRAMLALYNWIYLFHMPAFIFVSGYFSKSFVRKPNKEYRLTGFLALYVFFSVCLWAVKYLVTRTFEWRALFTSPSAQWYLLAMFFWLLIIPYAAPLSFPLSFSVSLAVALLAGAFPACGNFLALSRVIVFFPFFLLGYHYERDFFRNVSRRMKYLASVILAAVYLILFFYSRKMGRFLKIIYGRSAYSTLGFSTKEGIVLRLIWYCVSALMAALFLCIIPNRRLKVTAIGERTLGIYIIHRLIRDVFRNLDFYKYMGTGPILIITCLIVSFLVVWISSAKVITDGLNRLFYLKFLMKSSHEGESGPHLPGDERSRNKGA